MSVLRFRHRPARWLFCLALAASCLPAPAAEPLQLTAAQQSRLGIVVGPATPAAESGLTGLPARVTVPPQHLHLVSAPLAGVVSQLTAAPGQVVHRNEPLLRLASPMLAEIRRGVAEAGIQQQLAQRNFARDQQLFDEGLIAESRYRATQASLAQARAALAEREQALRLSGASARAGNDGDAGLVVRSPIDGIVLELMTSPSARVDMAAPLVKLARTDTLWLEIELPLRDAARAAAGGQALVRSGTADEPPIAARLIGTAADVAGSSQTLILRAQLDGAANRLRPGQFVSVDLVLPAGKAGLWRVPAVAVARINERATIFVLRDGVFRAQQVDVRQSGADDMVIAADLPEGSRIALSGATSLKAVATGVGSAGTP